MKLDEVRIRGFRNIEDSGWVDIHDDITTLVGKNESGKTSFLEAVSRLSDTDPIGKESVSNGLSDVDDSFPVVQARFSGSFEKYPHGDTPEGLVYKRRDGDIRVTDNFGLDSEHVILSENVARRLEDTFGTSHESVRELSPVMADIPRADLPEEFDRVAERSEISNLLDDVERVFEPFTDSDESPLIVDTEKIKTDDPDLYSAQQLLPEFPFSDDSDLLSDRYERGSLNSEGDRPFRKLLELGGINHHNFHKLKQSEKMSLMSAAEDKIHNQINDFWNQKSIEVRLRYAEHTDEFQVMIEDTELSNHESGSSHGLDRSLISPSERSRGFRWFLSFFVDQVTRENGDTSEGSTVYLIDDPAVYLHPEGKKDWLETIKSLTDDAQFVYSSHSPFLIDETRPSRIRIVEDRPNERTKVTDSIFEGDRSTLEPLRHALGVGLGDSLFVNRRKVLVEGPSDYFILTGVLSYLSEHEDDTTLSEDEVTLFPVDGGDEMVSAGRWMHSEEFQFVFLLDNDDKGTEVKGKLEDDGLLSAQNVFLLQHERAKQSYHVEIEDMFHPEFYLDCLNDVYGDEQFREEIEEGDNDIDDLSGLDPITLTEADDEGWMVGDEEEYKGMKIVSKVEAVFTEQGYSELEVDKVSVAKEIQRRLEQGYGFREEDVEAFKKVLGQMNAVLYDE